MSAPVSTSPTVEIGNPVKLFDVFFGGTTSWDVAPDGQRFLINGRANDTAAPTPLTVVQHFDRVLREASEKRD